MSSFFAGLLDVLEIGGPFIMLAFAVCAMICLHIWLPISTFARNPVVSILAIFMPIVGIVLGLFHFQVAKYPLLLGFLFFIGAVGTFILRSLSIAFFTMPTT